MGVVSYTIGELARAADVPTTTVRYYERRRLLTPETRSGSNYRLYGAASIERLRFIKAAQGAGFTLSDIESLLDLRDDSRAPNKQVQGLIDERLRRVAEQIDDLEEVERALKQWRRRCKGAESTGHCEVIEGLVEPRCGSKRRGS